MSDRTPYTYHLYHKPTEKHYYGSRFAKGCHPSDLWVKYFTSSPIIKDLIKIHGKDSFNVEVRKTFDCPIKCQNYENKVLRRLGVPYNKKWYNRHYGHVYHHECQSNGGKELSRKRKLDSDLNEYLRESSQKGALISSLKKNTLEYKQKRSTAGKKGGISRSEKKLKALKENHLRNEEKIRGSKWMFNLELNSYKRIPLSNVPDFISKGWILKFRSAWNKGQRASSKGEI